MSLIVHFLTKLFDVFSKFSVFSELVNNPRNGILVCGKEDCGKSTIAAMLAKYLANNGYKVLVVDADESNHGLYRMLGLRKVKTLTEYLGGKKSVKAAINVRINLPTSIDYIPKEILTAYGQAQPSPASSIFPILIMLKLSLTDLAKEFIKRLKLKEGEIIIVDTEAGIEHFGGGIDLEVDVIVNVAEPSIESLELSDKIMRMAKKSKLKHVFLLNKALPDISEKIKPDVVIPFDQTLIYSSLEGKEVEVIPQI